MDKKAHIVKETLRLLNLEYPRGLYEWLYACKREAYDEIFSLIDEVDRVYKVGTVGELKAVLREYWRLHMAVIDEFNEAQVDDTEMIEARREYGERLQA